MKPYQSLKIGSPEYQETHRARKFPNGQVWMLETSMDTMMSYIHKNGIGLLTAFRGDYDLKANLHRNDFMAVQFKKNGIKFIEVDGVFIENEGTNKERHVEELTFAVPFIPEDWEKDLYGERQASNLSFGPSSNLNPLDKFAYFLNKIGGIFNQDAIIIAHPDLGLHIHYRNGDKEKIFTVATIEKIGKALTRLRYGCNFGRNFIFMGTRAPHNHIDAFKLEKEGLIF